MDEFTTVWMDQIGTEDDQTMPPDVLKHPTRTKLSTELEYSNSVAQRATLDSSFKCGKRCFAA